MITGECDFCGWEQGDIHEVNPNPLGKAEIVRLCDLCWASSGGNAAMYPQQYADTAEVLRTMIQMTHYILAVIPDGHAAVRAIIGGNRS